MPQNMLMDALFEDPWTNACRAVLQDYDYIKLKTVRLQGLVLSVYCLRKHILNIREVESDYTRTGLSGMWVSTQYSKFIAHITAFATWLKNASWFALETNTNK